MMSSCMLYASAAGDRGTMTVSLPSSRKATIIATVCSTSSLMAFIIALPLMHLHSQKITSAMLAQVELCKLESRDIWKQMVFFGNRERIERRTGHYGISNRPVFNKGTCCACTQGPPGQRGSPGKDGMPGSDGFPGENGARGRNGVYLPAPPAGTNACQTCPQSAPGPPGLPGPKGQRGFPGKPGPEGKPGESSRSGPPGPPGLRGEPGPPGPKGPRGDQGKVLNGAPPGPTGPPGSMGPRGPPGIKGHDGEPGLIGNQGIRGPVGDRGNPGSLGLPGPPGPIGSPGTPGSCSHCQGGTPTQETHHQNVNSNDGESPSYIRTDLNNEIEEIPAARKYSNEYLWI